MGWKNVKEHYRILHIVQVLDGSICIGSEYIHDLIRISLTDYSITRSGVGKTELLDRYQQEMEEDPDKLRVLIETPDVFEADLTVYYCDDGAVCDTLCEKPGWPNCTHDGMLMYDNTFSQDRQQVAQWGIDNAKGMAKFYQEQAEQAERRASEMKSACLNELRKRSSFQLQLQEIQDQEAGGEVP